MHNQVISTSSEETNATASQSINSHQINFLLANETAQLLDDRPGNIIRS